MKWIMKEPKRGDMIRVASGSTYHFGIYVSDDEVIQFGLAPSQRAVLRDSEVEVLSSDIYTFLAGGFLEVCEFDRKERKKNRKPDEVIAYARSKIGMRGYNIIYNNCEHFANECISGERICHQADDVRAMFRNMPIVDVYTAALPDLLPAFRAGGGYVRPRYECHCGTHRPKWYPARLLWNTHGWDCASGIQSHQILLQSIPLQRRCGMHFWHPDPA